MPYHNNKKNKKSENTNEKLFGIKHQLCNIDVKKTCIPELRTSKLRLADITRTTKSYLQS